MALKALVEYGANAGDGPVAQFIHGHEAAQLYHTPAWCATMVEEVGGEEINIVVRDAERIEAWMHLLVTDAPFGRIANSNPYFGSNGGILATSDDAFDLAAATALETLRACGALVCNIIEPIQDPRCSRYRSTFPVVAGSKRITHVKELDGLDSHERMLNSVDGLIRSNLKRRCTRAGIEVARDGSDTAVDWLLHHHRAQAAHKGIAPKERSFLQGWRDLSPAFGDPQSRLYVARMDGQTVAALYLRTWRDWVEYLVPVLDPDACKHQPLTAVIFEAMIDCARDGFSRWSFGASGVDLDSVHKFKQRWRGSDIGYNYHLVDLGGADAVRDYMNSAGTAGYHGYFLYPMQ